MVVLFSLALAASMFFVFGKKQKVIVLSQQEAAQKEDVPEAPENVQIPDEEKVPGANPTQFSGSQAVENQKPLREQVEKEKSEPEKQAHAESAIETKNRLVSFGFSKSSGRKIDTIVIHSTYNALGGDEYDIEKIIGIYESYKVAAHYLIGRDGSIYRLVEEKNIAYHAGVSKTPDGRSDVNNFSIGIEMVGNKTDGYSSKQYNSVSKLVDDIKERYEIKYVLGHKDIAPGRKDDPWKFDFDKI